MVCLAVLRQLRRAGADSLVQVITRSHPAKAWALRVAAARVLAPLRQGIGQRLGHQPRVVAPVRPARVPVVVAWQECRVLTRQ